MSTGHVTSDREGVVKYLTVTEGDGEIPRVRIGPTDPISDLPVFVDFDHHQNHEGEAYQYFYNATLNGTIDFRLVVPAYATPIHGPHVSFELISEVTSSLTLFESPTVSLPGTAVDSIVNRNRIGTPNVPGMAIHLGSTFTAVGTTLSRYITITGARNSIGTDSSRGEWILKPLTSYLLRLTTTASGQVMLRANWYEDLGV